MRSHFTVPLPRSLIQVYESRFRFWTKNRDCSDLPFLPQLPWVGVRLPDIFDLVAELPPRPRLNDNSVRSLGSKSATSAARQNRCTR
jgi:hypothetical protein